MIPQQLTLKNFLSYQEVTLNFQGLHTACICGPNGAGKSSLLEAIAWALWGQSRAASEDDIIHLGCQEAKVDFIFTHHQQIYRVIRTRQRGQATSLEFQIAQLESQVQGSEQLEPSASPNLTDYRFRTLTERGVRATQERILQHLKLDYDTFINSAYLRQGRADEFMLKRPSERKQILADLLKLDQYDQLAEQAKDQSRQLKGQTELIEQQLQTIQEQLRQEQTIDQQKVTLEATLANLQEQYQQEVARLQTLQLQQQQRQTWEQQLVWQQQHQTNLSHEYQRLLQERSQSLVQQHNLETILQEEATILAGYQQWQTLQADEEAQGIRWQAHQVALQQKQTLQQQQEEHINQLRDGLRQSQVQLDNLMQQSQEHQKVLSKEPEIEAAIAQLQQARRTLSDLDQLHTQITPLLQRKQQLHQQLERVQTRLGARLEEVQATVNQLQKQQEHHPQLQQTAQTVMQQISYLEHRKLYQQKVLEKGQERRHFLERLQEQQREYETQLAELDQKLQLLQAPDATCPLCDHPLDEQHWSLVLERHQTEREDILTQLWVLREQLTASDREIQLLRQEYRALDQELTSYSLVLQQRGQLQAQLQQSQDIQGRLQQLLVEQERLQQQLEGGDYAADLREELHFLEQRLNQICGHQPYDEKNHALARGEVDRWRWAEIKQAELKQAQRRQAHIQQRIPELEAQIQAQQQQIDACKQADLSPLQQQIEQLEQHIQAVGYVAEHHQALRIALRDAQIWHQRYQELRQVQQTYPLLQQRLQELEQTIQLRQQDLQGVTTQTQAIRTQLDQTPDCQAEIQQLERTIWDHRTQLDEQLAELGRLQQQQQQLISLSQQQSSLKGQLRSLRGQIRIYQELSQAFGRNGIQALMIENVLPQLEAETNKILARLSANQLHVQFVTQRAGKSKTKIQKSALVTGKLIDTLDILIADAQGTRPYETYSGGEAFRVNFAIRLALSHLLAQQAGTALQLLIVDEGFGTQDDEGCDRLIAAINAIAPDFACILTVTHIPHLKEAFQTRIEVFKTEKGSQLQLLV